MEGGTVSKPVLSFPTEDPYALPLEGPVVPGPGPRPSAETEFLVKVC